VASPARFAAFLDGAPSYVAVERPCAKCGDHRKRTRDRACYGCHLRRSGENFERMKAGLAPKVSRSRDGHLDLLERRRAEKGGECATYALHGLTAKRWPTGRLEVTFPDGWNERDMATLSERELLNAIGEFPTLADVLRWAGWTLPYGAGGATGV
jgi:hypothetical protein